MKFNDKLMKLRKENSLSQEELAEKLGVTRQTISKWELGQTTPDMEKLSQISNVFGVSVDELLNEAGDNYQTDNLNSTEKKKNKNIIIIILVGVIVVLLGFAIFSVFNGGNKENNNQAQSKNTGIFGWFFDIIDNNADKVIDKAIDLENKFQNKIESNRKEIEEKNDKEGEEKFKKVQEEFENKYNEGVEELKEKKDKFLEEHNMTINSQNQQLDNVETDAKEIYESIKSQL